MFEKLVTIMVLMAMVSMSAEEVPMTEKMTYCGTNYTVDIHPSGLLTNCRFKSVKLFASNGIMGNYVLKNQTFDTRMFQNTAEGIQTTREQLDGNIVRVNAAGILKNGGHAKAAIYRECLILEPNGMKIDYQVIAKLPMSSHQGIFQNVMTMPAQTIVDRGMALTLNNKTELFSISPTCEWGRGYHRWGLQQVRVSLPDGIFHIRHGPETVTAGKDCRSWGEKAVRFDTMPFVIWRHKLIHYQPEKVWKWSVEYRFEPFED